MDIQSSQVRRRQPAKQARSRQTRERLIGAGIRLFDTREYEDIAISELAAAAGCSVGAFYHHFADKEDYYDAVVAAQLETLWGNFEQRFRPAEMAGLPTRTVLARAVGFMRAIMSDNQSLIRISFRRSLADEAAWMPIRGFGRTFEARLFDLLATRSQDFAVADWRQAYAVGMQIVYGTMLTAILRRPGPMMIEDEQMAEVLTDMLVRQLRLR